MTPEDRVREFWEQRGTPLSVASITELVRKAENDALKRAAETIYKMNARGNFKVNAWNAIIALQHAPEPVE